MHYNNNNNNKKTKTKTKTKKKACQNGYKKLLKKQRLWLLEP